VTAAAPTYTTEGEVSEWIESLKPEGIVRLELRSASGDRAVWRRPLAANSDSVKLASLAIQRAKSNGAGMSCVRATFFLRAFDSSGGDALDEQTIVVAGGNAGKGESSEEGTALERWNSHLLKSHAELHRLLVSSQEGRQMASERLITQLGARLDNHEDRYVKVLALYETLVSHQAEREQAARQFTLDERKQEMLGKKLDQVTPIVMNRLLGGGPGKGTPFMGEEMVKQLLANMSKDTIDKIMAGLPPEQSALFAEIYMAYATANEAAEKAEKQKINEGASVSSAGAGGGGGGASSSGGTNGTTNGKINPKDGAS
jgi:hypothetical protein